MDSPTTPNSPQTPQNPPPSLRSNLPTDVARLPIPGNAELLIYILALFLAMLVCWISDSLGSPSWLEFFRWTTFAYIISRGIAKASRVLEQ